MVFIHFCFQRLCGIFRCCYFISSYFSLVTFQQKEIKLQSIDRHQALFFILAIFYRENFFPWNHRLSFIIMHIERKYIYYSVWCKIKLQKPKPKKKKKKKIWKWKCVGNNKGSWINAIYIYFCIPNAKSVGILSFPSRIYWFFSSVCVLVSLGCLLYSWLVVSHCHHQLELVLLFRSTNAIRISSPLTLMQMLHMPNCHIDIGTSFFCNKNETNFLNKLLLVFLLSLHVAH